MLSSFFKASSSRPPWFVSNFDSATGLVKALANCLHREGFPGAGHVPESELLAKVTNALPWSLQRRLYVMSSAKGAVDYQKLNKIRAEDFSEWVCKLYPKRKYPAIFIGSSSGPAMHLAAAMGVPWLPQTFLIPVKTPGLSPDQPIQRMEWAQPWAKQLLANNPDLQLHHMMDPVQDRPMLGTASYFRVKRLYLGQAYKQFISDHLEKDGTIILVECQKSWPATRVDDRHYFQFGGLGGLTIEEYFKGSERVKEFLKQAGSPYEKWDAPQPDAEQPESEWGFVPSLAEDAAGLARDRGNQVQRIVFDEPEDLSPFVADLYRWWYGQRGLPSNKLLAEMFFLTEPYWALRTGAVPFWLAFNAQASANRLKQYLQETKPFDEIYLLPFSNGVDGIGFASEKELKSILALARQKGEFLGATPGKYPFDFGLYARYEKALKAKISTRYPTEDKLSIHQLYNFIEQSVGKYKVTWPDHVA